MENLEFPIKTNENIITRGFFKNSQINKLKIEFCTQGIEWAKINKDRDVVRQERLIHHKNHRNNEINSDEMKKKDNFRSTIKKDIFYQFKQFHQEIPIEVQHFQLRKNLKILNNKELVYIRSHGIEKFNIITKKKQFLFIFEGQDNDDQTKVTCFDIVETENGDNLICCGKVDGQIIFITIKYQDLISNSLINEKSKKIFNYQYKFNLIRKLIAPSENNNEIINNVQFEENGKRLIICSNDNRIRVFNLEINFMLVEEYKSVSATNHCSFSFDRNLLAGVGDCEQIEIYDPKTQTKILDLYGHHDFGFSVKFGHYSNLILASGNQDQCCKLWDMRRSREDKTRDSSLQTLCGKIESIGELMFTQDNKFIVYAENLDFINIYNIQNFTLQELSYFGSTCGMAYNQVNQNIYVSISDSTYHGIMVYDKILPFNRSLYR